MEFRAVVRLGAVSCGASLPRARGLRLTADSCLHQNMLSSRVSQNLEQPFGWLLGRAEEGLGALVCLVWEWLEEAAKEIPPVGGQMLLTKCLRWGLGVALDT